MAEIDYGQLDADDTSEEIFENHPPQLAPAALPRNAPLTEEQRLTNALAKVESLQLKVTKRRDEQRHAFIEQLYRAYGVVVIDGDLTETRRLAALSAKLIA